MLTATTDALSSSGEPVALLLALAALLVSGLAVIVPAATGRQQRLRDDRAKWGEMYLELVELIERHGLWVVDRTYDLLEIPDDEYETGMPLRRTEQPDRTLRVRARAIVSAYASTEVSDSFSQWQVALEEFEQKLEEFAYLMFESGPDDINTREAEPLRDSEVAARRRVADAVNAQLVQDRRWRRRSTSSLTNASHSRTLQPHGARE